MKKTVLLFIAFVFTYTSFAQEIATPAQTLQVNAVEMIELPVNILDEMRVNYPALYSQYMKGKKHSRTGWVLFGTGGAFLAFGCYLFSRMNTEGGDIRAAWIGIPSIEAGALCLVASAPYFISGSIKKNRAVEEFNRQYYSSTPSPRFQLNVYPNKIGIAYVF